MCQGHPMLPLCRSSAETLPLGSSPNFTDKDIGEPILDVILQPGDMLYFPRGTIHQVAPSTLSSTALSHVTLISLYSLLQLQSRAFNTASTVFM